MRRRRARWAPDVMREFIAAYRCPDCNSESGEPIHIEGNRWSAEIRHDDSCPWYAKHIDPGTAATKSP